MNSGLQELGLALFTTFSPSCAVAVAVVAFAIMRATWDDLSMRLAHRLIILLSGALVGFLASTTQLGSPDNALFVLTGVGRSPLSNEVTSVVAFLGMTGLFWITSFYNVPLKARKIWTVLIMISACLSMVMVSRAYSVHTIPTWNSAFVPANLILSALVGGLTVGGLYLNMNSNGAFARQQKALCACAAVLLCANAVVLVLQDQSFLLVKNSFLQAAELMRSYPISIAAYVLLVAIGIATSLLSGKNIANNRKATFFAALSVAFLFAGIFIIRLAFYGMYMTVGL